MKHNILFTCAGRRNYLINYFKKELNGDGLVIATDNQLNAPALIDADVAFTVPDIYDDNYIPRLKEIINEFNVCLVISLNDLELPILSKYKHQLESKKTKVLISDETVISIGFDKWKTYQFLKKIGLNTPKTFISIDEAIKCLENGSLKFPLVIKPRWGSGSIGVEFPESIEELRLAYNLQKIKLKRTILNTASKEDIENSIIIQEKLDGKEFGLDIVNNFKGDYFGTFAREKISMRSGETDKAQSIVLDIFDKVGKEIGSSLKHIGIMDVDVFLVKKQLYVLELNPRFGGGYPFSHEAGANIAAVYIGWLKRQSNIDILKHINYQEHITFSKCDRLLKVSN
ncbi:ATP-grasp domain-containing protein [uncultured Algibacter sp.]|uniref:ATP-grasp domain-containing protein n=1 Tax=uncultured Algibacter sp. TaxID=298659 RepID=UPI0026306496|nr:ATP-grasp domain-containing protein [uncultured Algibacter sp.]